MLLPQGLPLARMPLPVARASLTALPVARLPWLTSDSREKPEQSRSVGSWAGGGAGCSLRTSGPRQNQLPPLPALPSATAALRVRGSSRNSCGRRRRRRCPGAPGARGRAPSRLVPPTVGRGGQGEAPGEGGESSTQRLCQGDRNLFPFSWIKS